MLTPLQRRVWFMHRNGGLGPTAIGRALGLSPQNVNTLLRRIEKRIDRALRQGAEAAALGEPLVDPEPTTRWLRAFPWPRG